MKYLSVLIIVLLSSCAHYTPTVEIKQNLNVVLTPETLDDRPLFIQAANKIEQVSDYRISVSQDPTDQQNTRTCYVSYKSGEFLFSPGIQFKYYADAITDIRGGNCSIYFRFGKDGINSETELYNLIVHELVHALIGRYHNNLSFNSVMQGNTELDSKGLKLTKGDIRALNSAQGY